MTTFTRTDVLLTAGGPLPTETIGASGFTEILTPASYTGTKWTTEIGGQSLTLGASLSASSYQGYPSVLTKGDSAANDGAGKALFPAEWAPPTRGFTVQIIGYLMAPTGYVWEFGQYRLLSLNATTFRLEHQAQTTSLTVPNPANAYSILARCDGTNTRLMAGATSVGAGTIDATPITTARSWVGRTSAYAAGTHIFRVAYAPRALSDTEMTDVQTTARTRYPFLTA